jgi:glycosyltransferase involved in cell wall biosynthesis
LPPFIDTAPFRAAQRHVAPENSKGPPLLLSVGMMRTRAKLASYRVLAEALALLKDRPWRALLVGDGPARAEVEALMAPLGPRVCFAGAVPHEALPALYAGADLYLWPAIDEAFGMAFLEAQAAGLPVVAGRTGGVPAVVADGVTGFLTPVGDARAFASAVARLLEAPAERVRLAAAARERIAAYHDERAAAHALAAALRTLR